MQRLILSSAVAALAAAGAIASAIAAPAATDGRVVIQDNNCRGTADALKSFGLTADQRLVCFSERNPAGARTLGTVSGLASDSALVGIDMRVQDGKLYGVGNQGGVYTLDTVTGAATLLHRLQVPLAGTRFGVDFNPAADRLRIVSDSGQNLRHDVNTGTTLADDALDYAPGTPANSIGPTALGIAAAAYTNNDLDANTGTTLFVVDTTLDQVALQAPPNNGSLGATGKLTLDASGPVGFDIHSRLKNGSTASLQALATLATADGRTGLYRIDPATGKASLRGMFLATDAVVDIAIGLGQP